MIPQPLRKAFLEQRHQLFLRGGRSELGQYCLHDPPVLRPPVLQLAPHVVKDGACELLRGDVGGQVPAIGTVLSEKLVSDLAEYFWGWEMVRIVQGILRAHSA